jgi:RNA polymerase sigma factor (TIGR02999 family)
MGNSSYSPTPPIVGGSFAFRDSDVPALLHSWKAGDQTSETRLFESLYCSLRNKARQCLRAEQNAQSLSPTLLVHEAYLAMARSPGLSVQDRDHFIRLAGRLMRNFIVDRARERMPLQEHRPGRADENHPLMSSQPDPEQMLILAAALDKLERQSPALARVVEMRYFIGFTEDEIAALTGVATRTVRRQWQIAKLRLFDTIGS